LVIDVTPLPPHTHFFAVAMNNSDTLQVGDTATLLAYPDDKTGVAVREPLRVERLRDTHNWMFGHHDVISTRTMAYSGGPVFFRDQLVAVALASNVPWKLASDAVFFATWTTDMCALPEDGSWTISLRSIAACKQWLVL
jgi:hypothetical protein